MARDKESSKLFNGYTLLIQYFENNTQPIAWNVLRTTASEHSLCAATQSASIPIVGIATKDITVGIEDRNPF